MLRKKAPKPKAPDLRIFVKEEPKVPFEAAQGGHQQYDDVSQLSPHTRDATIQVLNPQTQQIVTADGTTNTNTAVDQIWFQLNLGQGIGIFNQLVGATVIVVQWEKKCTYLLVINDDPNNSIYMALNTTFVAAPVNSNLVQATIEIKPKEMIPIWVHISQFAIVASGANTPVRVHIGSQDPQLI